MREQTTINNSSDKLTLRWFYSLCLSALLVCSFNASSQKININNLITAEQSRIDLLDGKLDSAITLSTPSQDLRAARFVFVTINSVRDNINNSAYTEAEKDKYLRALMEYSRTINTHNLFQFTANEHSLSLANKLITLNNPAKELDLLKTNLKVSINLYEFIIPKPYAKEFWLYAANFYPTDVLNKFMKAVFSQPGTDVVAAVAKTDPNAVKQYFGSTHHISRSLQASKDPVVMLIMTIYKTYGMQSKAYSLLDLIYNGQMDLEDAEIVSKMPEQFYKVLIELRKKKNIYANYSVDKELQTLAMETVVEVNLRHEDKDAFRFEPVDKSNAYEIYTDLVYTSEEVFTSSFLGLYQRMNEKRKEKSGYEFLKNLGFNRFRIFLKECAGYNKLDDFLNTMSKEEVDLLIMDFVSGLNDYGGDLGPAVDVADTYGSLNDTIIKKQFMKGIERELVKLSLAGNEHGVKIYGLLYKLTGGDPNTITNLFTFNLPNLDIMPSSSLFIDGKHIQQHFFFDDEDGQAAFSSWLSIYNNANWKKVDKGDYIIIQSVKGKNIWMYGNKPQFEIRAQEALSRLFAETKRYPDLVVHRGHSYYVLSTINSLTNSCKIALMGSCGGYQNVSLIMENAMDVQIVSTKQIGTGAINNVLISETTETIRQGKDIVWPELWKRIQAKVGNNLKFSDYVPPYKNLGAKFIKAYNEL
ncbi:MAG: hypothetical protein H7321_10370 [Bacteroidia bacterium]|nr:hypothetical protein [Bacteroidia bacterium]